MSTHQTDVAAQLAALDERISALEGRAHSAAGPDDGAFWALKGLEDEHTHAPGSSGAGSVMIVGSLCLPTGDPVAWQQTALTEGMWDLDWSEHAAGFAALGHPVRVELLRHILSGTRTTAALAATEALGTTGQLHHHLRLLVSAGWVQQTGRGVYEVPAARIVPLMACMMAAPK